MNTEKNQKKERQKLINELSQLLEKIRQLTINEILENERQNLEPPTEPTAVELLEDVMKTSKYFYKLLDEIESRSTIERPNIFVWAKQIESLQKNEALYRGLLFNFEL